MREITIDELEGAAIIDVREQDEWDAGHVPGAVHIPMGEVVARIDEIPDEAAIICRSGGRSARVVAYLEQSGRTAVNVRGGTQAWIDEGRALEH